MSLKNFIRKGTVRKATPDKALARALLKGTRNDLKFLEKLKLDEKSSRKIMTNYYDSLRSILEAIASINGHKIYSHEAFKYFLKEILKEDLMAIKFDRFRRIRNSINYYGEDISVIETKENVKDIKEMVNLLINKYLKDFEK